MPACLYSRREPRPLQSSLRQSRERSVELTTATAAGIRSAETAGEFSNTTVAAGADRLTLRGFAIRRLALRTESFLTGRSISSGRSLDASADSAIETAVHRQELPEGFDAEARARPRHTPSGTASATAKAAQTDPSQRANSHERFMIHPARAAAMPSPFRLPASSERLLDAYIFFIDRHPPEAS